MQNWEPSGDLRSPFRASPGIAFCEGVACVERGFESGTQSKYLWIVLGTSSRPSHSCHAAVIGRLCSSPPASVQKGSSEGVAALSTAAMGLMVCGLGGAESSFPLASSYPSEGRSSFLFLLSLHQS